MGSGKTSFFNAIAWCLYGEEKQTKKLEGLPIVNTRALIETEIGKSLEMKVSLIIGTPEVPLYQISRVLWSYKKNDDFTLETKNGVLLPKCLDSRTITHFMEWSEPEGWLENDYFDSMVKQLLPRELVDFFLFDGEELVKFFDEGLKMVKNGIEAVSQIDLIQESIRHLQSVSSKYRGETKGVDSSADKLLNEIDSIRRFQSKQDSEREELEKQTIPIQDRLEQIEMLLRTSARDVIREKQKTREVLKNQKSELYTMNQSIRQQHLDLLISWGPQVYLYPALQDTVELLNKAIQDKILPPPIDRDYCISILEKGVCICGNDISHGSGRGKVASLLDIVNVSEIYPIANNGIMILPNYINSFLNKFENLNKLQTDQGSNEQKIEQLQQQIIDISATIRNYDDEAIKSLEQEHISSEKWITEINGRLAILRSDVQRAGKDIERLTAEHNKIIEKNSKLDRIKLKMQFCDKAGKILSTIKSELTDKVREIVEVKTNSYFLNIIWKKGTFTKIKIDDRYLISVHHVDGFVATGTLSAGETLYLALSFIAALREVTGFKFPIIIDTPLGRVSGRPKILAAENLPKYLPGVQITMLVTDTEYASPTVDEDSLEGLGSFRDKICNFVGKEYKLIYDESKRDTDVVNYVS